MLEQIGHTSANRVRWLSIVSGQASTLRLLAATVPALVVVIFAGLIALLALMMSEGRREYALDVADRSIELAAVLLGASQDNPAGASAPELSAPSPTVNDCGR